MNQYKNLRTKLKKINTSSLSEEQLVAIQHILENKTVRENRSEINTDISLEQSIINPFTKIIENSPYAIAISDTKGYLVKVNKTFTDIYGNNVENFNLFKDSIIRKAGYVSELNKAKKGNIIRIPEIYYNPAEHITGAQNKKICLRTTLFPVHDNNGDIINYTLLHEDITDIRQTEKNLFKNKEKYKYLFENMQAVYFEVDLTGKILDISSSVEFFSKYKRNELIGTDVFGKYININDRKIPLEKILNEGRIKDYRLSLKDKDGSVIYSSVNAEIIKNGKGIPEKIAGVIVDISALYQTIEKLKKSEKKYRELFESINDVVFTMDFKGNITSINPKAYNLLGYSTDEINDFNIGNYLTPESLKIAFENINKKLNEVNEQTVYELDFINKDGTLRPFEITSLLKYKNGKPYEIFGIARDVTDRKRINEELKHSEERYRLIFENAPVGIITTDITGNIIEINSTFLNLSGTLSTINEIKGLNIFKSQSLIDAGLVNIFKKCIKTGEPVISKNLYYLKELNKQLYIRINVKPIKDTNGIIIGLLAMFEDITEQKNNEQQIKSTLIEKELLIKEIHHRVKNNMQIIISLINMQITENEDENIKKKFIDIQQRVRTMSIVHENLYMSNDLTQIDLGNYLNKLTSNILQIYPHKFEITTDINVSNIFIGIDIAIPLGLIVNELISNSLKYAFPDEIGNNKENRIYIKLISNLDNMKIIIGDNGIGLPENIEKIKNKTLGLLLVEIMIGQLRGQLEVDNTNGVQYSITIDI